MTIRYTGVEKNNKKVENELKKQLVWTWDSRHEEICGYFGCLQMAHELCVKKHCSQI